MTKLKEASSHVLVHVLSQEAPCCPSTHVTASVMVGAWQQLLSVNVVDAGFLIV
jgi:hypothetical protein